MASEGRAKAGRKKTGKKTVTIRLSLSTKELLDKVPLGEIQFPSLSAYCEKAILAQLKKDGIK
jgi:hypothetical protein